VQLARQHRKRRVLAELVVIVEVFIPQCQAEDALSHQGLDLMLDSGSIMQCALGWRRLPMYCKRGLMAAYQSAYKMWDRSRRHSEDRQVSIKE
jgi:hypothetical protein